jgi:hypothetical protein
MVRERNGTFEINKGSVYRLPKPQELGILFGSLPERVLEKFFNDNPKAMTDFEETVFNLLTPGMVPNIATPAIETYFNKSLFTGNRIVPAYLEGVYPEYQYTEYTSETAKSLSKLIGHIPSFKTGTISPLVLDNWVQAWSGNLGKYAVSIMDQALYKSGAVKEPVKPESSLADIPFIKAFVVRYPSASPQSVVDFRENYKEHKQTLTTIRHLAKTGDFANMQKELELQENHEKLVSLEGIQEALSTQNQLVHQIMRDDSMSRSDKRQLIDNIYYSMIQMARSGNELVLETKKALNARDVAKKQSR